MNQPNRKSFNVTAALRASHRRHLAASLTPDLAMVERTSQHQLRIIAALRYSKEETKLRVHLKACLENNGPQSRHSAACAYCTANFAASVCQEAIALAEAHREGTTGPGTLAIVRLGRQQPSGKLRLRRIREYLRVGFDSAAVGTPIVGALHPQYIEHTESGEGYQLRLSLAIFGNVTKGLVSLLDEFGKVESLTPLKDPAHQLRGLVETECFRHLTLVDRAGNLHSGVYPLTRSQTAEVALWLDQQHLVDRLLLCNVERSGARLLIPSAIPVSRCGNRE